MSVRLFYAVIGLAFTNIAIAQKVQFELTGGPVIPTGKEIRHAYSLGFGLAAGSRMDFNKMFISGEVFGKLLVNNPSSSVKDNLFFYGLAMHVGCGFSAAKFRMEPFLGIGYGWGSNFLTDRTSDLTGGFFHDKTTMMNLNGAGIHTGATLKLSKKIGVGFLYQIYRANATLSGSARQNAQYYGSSSSLYGNFISFPSQKMALDNLTLQITLKL